MLNRLDASIQAMAQGYSQFHFQIEAGPSGDVGTWRGSVQPIKRIEELDELLDDLAHDRDVYCIGDEIRHLQFCRAPHCRHEWMGRVGDLQTPFDLEIHYDGGPALPRCYVVSPWIPIPKRRHMWNDGAICAFLASDRVWMWHNDTVATFVPHALIWLVKWSVFDRTGSWVGAEYESDPRFHFTEIRPKDLCWCGSGAQYRKCHRKGDMAALGFRPMRIR